MFDYDKFFKKNPLGIHNQPERHDKIASLCKGHVIDIGCGTGTLTDYYQGDYCGYDISGEAIKKAREHRRKNACFFTADFTKPTELDFSNFDTIVMAEFLEHIENDEEIFKSIKETAHHGTRIIISVPNHNRVPSPDHVRTFTVAQLKKRFSELGNIKFHNWLGQNQRIILTIDFKEPQKKEITLGIIAKDEEKGIEKTILTALETTQDIVILVDNRTKDKTEQIAKLYTENTFLYTWQNDFSKARNELLSKVKTPWVLFIDGHEYLERAVGLENLNELENDALMCEIRLESNSIVRYPRLHRSNLKYKDQVHNKLVCKNLGNYNNILLVHDRKKGQSEESVKEREKQRDEMVIGIMGKQIKENKKNTRAALHLGLHYHARQNHKKAIKYYKLYLKYSNYPGERWYIRFNLALLYSQTKRPIRAEYQTVLMEKESPNRWETVYLRGVTLMDQRKYEEAILNLVKSLDAVKQESEYKPIEKDYSIIWNYIGENYFKLQKYYEAGEAFKRASQRAKDQKVKNLFKRRSKLMFNIAEKKETMK